MVVFLQLRWHMSSLPNQLCQSIAATVGYSWVLLAVVRLHVWCPQSQVVSQQLHYECRVLVRLLAQRIQLGNCIVERGLRQSARSVRRVQDLVVEHREVERKTKPDRMSCRQLGVGRITRSLVRHQTVLRSLLAVVTRSKLRQVPVIVTLPT